MKRGQSLSSADKLMFVAEAKDDAPIDDPLEQAST
jgi:hypothetical protein